MDIQKGELNLTITAPSSVAHTGTAAEEAKDVKQPDFLIGFNGYERTFKNEYYCLNFALGESRPQMDQNW